VCLAWPARRRDRHPSDRQGLARAVRSSS
jgi:hypothetical protein